MWGTGSAEEIVKYSDGMLCVVIGPWVWQNFARQWEKFAASLQQIHR